jgi:hypothetical protein
MTQEEKKVFFLSSVNHRKISGLPDLLLFYLCFFFIYAPFLFMLLFYLCSFFNYAPLFIYFEHLYLLKRLYAFLQHFSVKLIFLAQPIPFFIPEFYVQACRHNWFFEIPYYFFIEFSIFDQFSSCTSEKFFILSQERF